MKFIISFSLVLVLFLFVLAGCGEYINNSKTKQPILTDADYPTLDLYVDQCVPGGFTEDEVNNYLNNGYILDTLDNSHLFTVDFVGDGGPYQETGYVEAGTVMLINPSGRKGTGYFKLCGNHWLDEED